MTELGTLLVSVLGSAFTNGLWPAQAPDLSQAPYGTYLHFGAPNVFVAGTGTDQNQTAQIDIYAASYLDCEAIAYEIATRMAAQSIDYSPSSFTATPSNKEYFGIDPDVQLHRMMLEFSVWYRPGTVVTSFLPSDLPNLVAWWRVGQGIILGADGGVAVWEDASGNARHLMQGTAGTRPSSQSDGSLRFDGVNDFLKTETFAYAQPESIYLLMKQNSFVAIDYVFDGFATNSGSLRQSSASPALGLAVNNTEYAVNAALPIGAYGAVCVVINGANSLLRINNTSVAGNVASALGMAGFTLGAVGSGVPRQSDIQVKEVVLFSEAHDATKQQQMIDYLNSL